MVNSGIVDSLASYPRWMVIIGGILTAMVAIWIFGKILRWAIWILVIVALLAAGTFIVSHLSS